MQRKKGGVSNSLFNYFFVYNIISFNSNECDTTKLSAVK